MEKKLGWRIWKGVAAASMTAILVSFIAGCFYSIILVYPETPQMTELMNVFLFIGGTAAIVASGVVVPSLLLIGLPLYIASVQQHKVSLHIYAMAGLAIALIYTLILSILHVSNELLVSEDFYFAVISILISGPLVTSSFWIIDRPDRLA